MNNVLRGMLEDAQRYQVLAKRANGTLSTRPGVGPDNELVAGALKEIERLSHSQAREAKRLLARGRSSRYPLRSNARGRLVPKTSPVLPSA